MGFEPVSTRRRSSTPRPCGPTTRWSSARRLRLDMVGTGLPGVIWLLVILGADQHRRLAALPDRECALPGAAGREPRLLHRARDPRDPGPRSAVPGRSRRRPESLELVHDHLMMHRVPPCHPSLLRHRNALLAARIALALAAAASVPGVSLAAKTDHRGHAQRGPHHRRGEGLANGKLDYSTDDAGRLSIEWEKVASLTSPQEYQVELGIGASATSAGLASRTATASSWSRRPAADTLRDRGRGRDQPDQRRFLQRLQVLSRRRPHGREGQPSDDLQPERRR